jgi:hypothetical protein
MESQPKDEKQKNAGAVSTVVALVGAVGGAWYWFGGGLEKHAAHEVDKIENQVAADTVREYEIAKRGGDAMDTCVHAGLAAAAYLQATDEANYQKWKAIEREDCAKARYGALSDDVELCSGRPYSNAQAR